MSEIFDTLVFFGNPGSEYEYLKTKVIAVLDKRNCKYQIIDSFDPRSFIEQGLTQIPVVSLNGNLIQRKNLEIMEYLNEVIKTIDGKRKAPFSQILVPVDFSSTSGRAFRLAAEVAAMQKGELHLLHIEEPVVVPGVDGVFISEDPHSKQEQQLEDWATSLMLPDKRSGVVPQQEVRYGSPASEIVTRASELGRPLIVMGTSGLGQREQAIFGSVTVRVMSRANCPVMIVPASYSANRFRKIVFCSQGYNEKAVVIHELISLLKLFDAELHILHFPDKNRSANPEAMLEILKDSYPNERISVHELEDKDPFVAIDQYCKKEAIDLVSIVRGKRGIVEDILHKSWSKRMAQHNTLPLLIWPG